MNILISIGNSDDRLTQARWSMFIVEIRDLLDEYCRDAWIKVHGEWFSKPDSPWQNANWMIEAEDPEHSEMCKKDLIAIRKAYDQQSIAWTEGEVTFI